MTIGGTHTRRRARRKAHAILGSHFPRAFGDRDNPPPLSLGIRTQLLDARIGGFTEELLGDAILAWCARPAYLLAVSRGGSRHDLDGCEVQAVSIEDRNAAAYRLAVWIYRGANSRHRKIRDKVAGKLSRMDLTPAALRALDAIMSDSSDPRRVETARLALSTQDRRPGAVLFGAEAEAFRSGTLFRCG